MIKTKLGMVAAVVLLMLGWGAGAQTQQSGMTFFITSAGSGKGADLGGLAGADRICQSLAAAAVVLR
jgi:Na+/H+ antiporter NhaC